MVVAALSVARRLHVHAATPPVCFGSQEMISSRLFERIGRKIRLNSTKYSNPLCRLGLLSKASSCANWTTARYFTNISIDSEELKITPKESCESVKSSIDSSTTTTLKEVASEAHKLSARVAKLSKPQPKKPKISTTNFQEVTDAAKALLWATKDCSALIHAVQKQRVDTEQPEQNYIAAIHRAFWQVTDSCLEEIFCWGKQPQQRASTRESNDLAARTLLKLLLDLANRATELHLTLHLQLYQRLILAVATFHDDNNGGKDCAEPALILSITSSAASNLRTTLTTDFFRKSLLALLKRKKLYQVQLLLEGMMSYHGIAKLDATTCTVILLHLYDIDEVVVEDDDGDDMADFIADLDDQNVGDILAVVDARVSKRQASSNVLPRAEEHESLQAESTPYDTETDSKALDEKCRDQILNLLQPSLTEILSSHKKTNKSDEASLATMMAEALMDEDTDELDEDDIDDDDDWEDCDDSSDEDMEEDEDDFVITEVFSLSDAGEASWQTVARAQERPIGAPATAVAAEEYKLNLKPNTADNIPASVQESSRSDHEEVNWNQLRRIYPRDRSLSLPDILDQLEELNGGRPVRYTPQVEQELLSSTDRDR